MEIKSFCPAWFALVLFLSASSAITWNRSTLEKIVDLGAVDSSDGDYLVSVDPDIVFSTSNVNHRGTLSLGFLQGQRRTALLSFRPSEQFANFGDIIVDGYWGMFPVAVEIISDGIFRNQGRILVTTHGAEHTRPALRIFAKDWQNYGTILFVNGDLVPVDVAFSVQSSSSVPAVFRNEGAISLHQANVVLRNAVRGKGCFFLGDGSTLQLDILCGHDHEQNFLMGKMLTLKFFNFDQIQKDTVLKVSQFGRFNTIQFEFDVEKVSFGAEFGILEVHLKDKQLPVFLNIGRGYSEAEFRLHGNSIFYDYAVNVATPSNCIVTKRIKDLTRNHHRPF